MNLPRFALTHQPLVLSLVFVVTFVGIYNLLTMPRREDPEITIRQALVITGWPGASAKRVDELITDPLEKAVAVIAEIQTIKSKSLTGLSIIEVELEDSINNADQIWDDLRAKVRSAESKLPRSAASPFVNSDYGDVYEIVFALHQVPPKGKIKVERPYSPRELEIFAEHIEDRLELIPDVGKVKFWGVQPERIYVEADSSDMAKLRLTANDLRQTFEARNILLPGGELDTERVRYAVQPTGEFSTVAQIRDLIVARRDGVIPVKLGDLPIKVERRYDEPAKSLVRFSQPGYAHINSIAVGISMKSGRNVSVMSDKVDDAIANMTGGVLPDDIKLVRVNDLPRQVNERITDFQINLLQGVSIVLIVSLLIMGWRPAIIMAIAVPFSMLAAIALVRWFNIELEQFAIASLIIALGLVVDNAVVISDNVVRLIREGMPKIEACEQGAQQLAIPILTATLTTMFAFLPMLTITGSPGEYISSLPIVVSTTLAASYILAMTVTPISCLWLLKEAKTAPDQNLSAGSAEEDKNNCKKAASSLLVRAYEHTIRWAVGHRAIVLILAASAFIASLWIIPVIGSQFFPEGNRDQFFVKIWLPESAPIRATSRIAKTVEKTILDLSDDGISNVVSFIGAGGPRLMLTQAPENDYAYFALLLVNTSNADVTDGLVSELRGKLRDIPKARITVEKFVLGPPVSNPVEFRLSGPDPDILQKTAHQMVKKLKHTPGAMQATDDWGAAAFQIDIQINDGAVNLAGVTHSDVALATQAILSGAVLTSFREGDHLVPVVLRTTREKRQGLSDLEGIYVPGTNGQVPLSAVADISASWQLAFIARRDRIYTITIGAQTKPGVLPNNVAGAVNADFIAMTAELGPQYRLEQGGEQEETADTQGQVLTAVELTLVMIVLILIAQYNQFLKPLIILMTIPLALTGVLIGLLVTGWAMGFMANLGLLALIGIVINNAIVLIDFIENLVADGADLRDAVVDAGRLRMKPIFLTTVTTIGGLLPLSLFGGPLWAAMTNGMIFGLMFSTLLTLIVVPVLYVTFAERLRMRVI